MNKLQTEELKKGFTTGTCAAAATLGAAEMLLLGKNLTYVKVVLPNNAQHIFNLENIVLTKNYVSCAVKKDAGDDPDVTDGLSIFSRVELCEKGINISALEGIGKVTEKGLKVPVGEYAINPGPVKMIQDNLNILAEKYNYKKGFSVFLSIPGGEEVAKKTFNSRLGIMGGLSVLGTTGIVEPMSEKALIDTIKVFISKRKAQNSENIIISPGNYGLNYCQNFLGLQREEVIKISNYIGETIDYLVYENFKKVLLVGHIGKLVKVAAGVMNTHSKYADARLETLTAHSAILGANVETLKEVFNSKTTKAALDILKKESYYKQLCENIVEKIEFHLKARSQNKLQFSVILFDDNNNLIAKSKNLNKFLNKKENKNG